MNREEFTQYIESVRATHHLQFFIERFFRTNDDWERVAAHEFRNISLSSRTEATLEQIIARGVAIILGEPGSGKSTVAKASVQRAIDSGMAPLAAHLRSYDGDLLTLLEQSAPAELVRDGLVDGIATERALILDGVDEVPHAFVDTFVADLERTIESGAYRHVILTARQAFFATNRSRFRNPPEMFYVLSLTERDVRAYIQHHGGNIDLFLAGIRNFGLWSEITNPFALEVLYRMFAETGALGRLRHEAVNHVVESLISSRPHVAADRQRRALRMLAVAMETASRNELRINEAVQLLQAATPVTAEGAENLLNELTHSILVRTPNGISFQMRSHGEYLAAVELKGTSLDRVQLLVNYDQTRIPNESWRNCVSYLAELHPGVRRSFALHNPDWVIATSPHAFDEAERTIVVNRLFDRLADEQEYIRRHPFLNLDALTRFVTPDVERQLMADIANPNPVRAANAMVTLGARRVRSVVNVAQPIAVDRNRPQLLRESAISAVAAAGDSSLIPDLVRALDPNDTLYSSLLGCIGALVDATTLSTVLPILLNTDSMVSSAFYRFRELQSRDTVQAFLDFMTGHPTAVSSTWFSSYSGPLWEAMAELWDPHWAEAVAHVMVAWERARITPDDVEKPIAAIRRLPDHGEKVGQAILARFLASGDRLVFFSRIVAGFITPTVAGWLAQQPDSRVLMETMARFGSREVRRVLAPHLGGLVEAQDEAVAAMLAADHVRNECERVRLADQHSVVLTEQSLGSVLGVLSRLNAKDWPDLDDGRKAWLSQQCETWLQEIDPLTNVRWISENQLSHNPALPWLVRVIEHYGLRITNDVLIVQCMMSSEGNSVAAYHRRHGLSQAAVTELERIIADRNTSSGALYHFLSFLGAVDISTSAVGAALVAIADNAQRPEHIRSWAIRLACSKSVPDADLVELRGRLQGNLKDETERGLIDRQHRPTIERRIAALLADDAAMQAGDVPPPHDWNLGWIGQITSDVFWPRLVALRAQALRLALPNMAGLITGIMSKIDGGRLAAVVRDQIAVAPAAWRDAQEVRATEYERDARLGKAQATPFERIIHRLRRATTLGMFKIWCEGLTDGPTIEEFLAKIPDSTELWIVTDSLGGWNNILSPRWRPDRLRDGCYDLVVLLDGDKGRDFTAPGRPLNANALRVYEILADVGVELIVLDRYGIENYFSRPACEAVLGLAVGRCFPLSLFADANLNHNKNDNPRIAREMNIADLAGTDLLQHLEVIVARSHV
jgi:hypothetical protein